jgi:hypothetical protein
MKTAKYGLSKDAYPFVKIGVDGTYINDKFITPQSILIEITEDKWVDLNLIVDEWIQAYKPLNIACEDASNPNI